MRVYSVESKCPLEQVATAIYQIKSFKGSKPELIYVTQSTYNKIEAELGSKAIYQFPKGVYRAGIVVSDVIILAKQ